MTEYSKLSRKIALYLMKCEPPVVFDRVNQCLTLETHMVRFCLYKNGLLWVFRRDIHDQVIAEATREWWEKELWNVFGGPYWNAYPALYEHVAATVRSFEVVE